MLSIRMPVPPFYTFEFSVSEFLISWIYFKATLLRTGDISQKFALHHGRKIVRRSRFGHMGSQNIKLTSLSLFANSTFFWKLDVNSIKQSLSQTHLLLHKVINNM